MEHQMIGCELIDIPEHYSAFRSVDKSFAEKLAANIKMEGLHNPIVIRSDQTISNHYYLVQGWHRLYATKDVLKRESIAASILKNMDDREAELAMIAENIWRNPLTRNQIHKAIKRWHELFIDKYPLCASRGGAGGAASKKAAEERKAAETKESQSERFETKEGRANEKGAAEGDESQSQCFETQESLKHEEEPLISFRTMVAGATGTSDRSAERIIRIATTFDDAQLEILERERVTQRDQEEICKIKDAARRDMVIGFIEMGVRPSEALKPIREGPGSREELEARFKHNFKSEDDPDLSDDEWFELFCDEKAEKIKNPQYKIAAIFYRQTVNQRLAIQKKIKMLISKYNQTDADNPFVMMLNNVFSVSHPNDFPVCRACKGTGKKGLAPCGKCKGNGFTLLFKAET